MRFGILGVTEILGDDGSPLATGGNRRRMVLIVLALEAGRWVTRERLIDDVYGSRPPAGAANALQSQISRLRSTLRSIDRDVLEFRSAGYRLAVDPLDVDAHLFRNLAARGRELLEAGHFDESAGVLDEALGLWRGPALADVADAPFAQAPSHRLTELRLTALEDRMAAGIARGEGASLIGPLRDLVEAHPFRERPRADLIRALHATGRQAEALQEYERGRSFLAEELGMDPSPELEGVHLAILRGEPLPGNGGHAPRPGPEPVSGVRRPLSAPAIGAPAQLTSFVGGTPAVEEVADLLKKVRLVTLTGPGGVGKTRLAIETVRNEDDVCFVDLSLLDSAEGVSQAVLHALGMREPGWPGTAPRSRTETVDRMVEALEDRALLLVLDGCEHVLADTARLVGRLLGDCRRLRVLATSQENLGITGENLRTVAPLALPPVGSAPDEALCYPSVRLLADRAGAVRPDFTVNEANVEAVITVCRALDGLPLAIELAAARLNALTPEAIAERLDDRFSLLARGNRTAVPKHQTLRAVVSWSWGLLNEREQLLARRFTVFAGGADLEDVRGVCGPHPRTADLLAGLVEKSLIEAVDGASRYRMLATIRAFGAEHLARSGEQDEVHRAHAEHFLSLARGCDPLLRGSGQLEQLPRLLASQDNLHAALRWAVEHDTVMALEFMAVLSSYWWLRGRHQESIPSARTLLERIGDDVPEGMEEEYVLCAVNAAAADTVDDPVWDRAETLVAGLQRPLRRPLLSMLWPTVAGRAGRGAHGVGPFLERCGRDPDPWVRAISHVALGYLLFFHADPARAEASFTEGLSSFRSLGDRWGAVQALAGLATITSWRGDLRRTLALTDEALAATRLLGAVEDSADLVRLRAEGLLRTGDLPGAQEAFERAIDLARSSAVPGVLLSSRFGVSEVARLRGDLAVAHRLSDVALESVDSAGAGGGEAISAQSVLVGRGRLAMAEDDRASALHWYRRALDHDTEPGYPPRTTLAAEVMAEAALLAGDGAQAAVFLGACAAMRGRSEPSAPDEVRIYEAAAAMVGERARTHAYTRGLALSARSLMAEIDRCRRTYLG